MVNLLQSMFLVNGGGYNDYKRQAFVRHRGRTSKNRRPASEPPSDSHFPVPRNPWPAPPPLGPPGQRQQPPDHGPVPTDSEPFRLEGTSPAVKQILGPPPGGPGAGGFAGMMPWHVGFNNMPQSRGAGAGPDGSGAGLPFGGSVGRGGVGEAGRYGGWHSGGGMPFGAYGGAGILGLGGGWWAGP
ncbi:hypothetical protein LTR53_000972 [Teratosphaeriaceae sp. CCFEE 6253]|nr:hypothetical protein LTR53_000972 [Teratosphaeriaceae sp. CCFEE 6253]